MPGLTSRVASAPATSHSFREIAVKSVVVHTVTYVAAGVVAFLVLDYASWFADPRVAAYMRQTNDPMVMAGPLFQPIRGLLFGVVFFVLRDVVFRPRTGWRALWLTLLIVGILSPFGPTPSSIEGLVYTTWPLAWHLRGLPETVIQSLLLASILHAWVTRPVGRWVSVTLGIAFAAALILPAGGLLVGR
jgi:hypothetical protein